jgi:inorganic pyrophosphatase
VRKAERSHAFVAMNDFDPKGRSRFRPHPWHGLEIGPEPPDLVYAFIEITPFDLIKYEVDKASGYLRIDRAQRGSSQSPALYGFIPRTYCGRRVGGLSASGRHGDGDPLDICVLSERAITKSEILVRARIVGGLAVVDNGQADDKIIGVVDNDYVYGSARELADLPPALVERLRHYFETYKWVPETPLGRLSTGRTVWRTPAAWCRPRSPTTPRSSARRSEWIALMTDGDGG